MFLIPLFPFRMFTLESVLRSCARIFSRTNIQGLWPKLFGRGSPFPNQIIEMRGPSKYGIDLVLMEILTRMALPRTYDIRTSGRNATILYFSCKANFDHSTFRSYLLKVLSAYISDSFYLHELIQNAMNNLYIFDLEHMMPNFMSNQILDKYNIGLIVIDCMNGYIPELNLRVNHFECLTKIQYLQNMLSKIHTLTIYISNDTTDNPPTQDVFNIINNVFVIGSYSDFGVQINSYAYNFEHEIIFVDPVLLHT